MSNRAKLSSQTRRNWLIDAVVAIGGVLAALSGIYFLFLPSGGYEGGRNPMYGITILFSRHTWEDVHTCSGLLMMAAIVIHFALHWKWVTMMGRKAKSVMLSQGSNLSRFAKFNVALNALVGLSFLVCALSGVYFLFLPGGGLRGGSNHGWDPGFLLSRVTWDLIHTWSGMALIVAAVVHFWIHWRWVKNVTRKLVLSLLPQGAESVPVAGAAVAVGGKGSEA